MVLLPQEDPYDSKGYTHTPHETRLKQLRRDRDVEMTGDTDGSQEATRADENRENAVAVRRRRFRSDELAGNSCRDERHTKCFGRRRLPWETSWVSASRCACMV